MTPGFAVPDGVVGSGVCAFSGSGALGPRCTSLPPSLRSGPDRARRRWPGLDKRYGGGAGPRRDKGGEEGRSEGREEGGPGRERRAGVEARDPRGGEGSGVGRWRHRVLRGGAGWGGGSGCLAWGRAGVAVG